MMQMAGCMPWLIQKMAAMRSLPEGSCISLLSSLARQLPLSCTHTCLSSPPVVLIQSDVLQLIAGAFKPWMQRGERDS